jgi:hypothetical protein
MDEVMGLLEGELAALFVANGVVDCAVLTAGDVEERPDEYLSIVAVESEYRAGTSRLRAVTDFFAGNALRSAGVVGSGEVTLALSGFVMRSISSQVGERSRAEIARVRFGVAAMRPSTPAGIRDVLS